MKEDKLLYQIKTLEKSIVRLFASDINNEFSCSVFPPTPTQMEIVEYILNNSNNEIYQKDLENVLNLRRATVSGVLQTMEKNNLIKRVIDDNDYRVKKIILNPEALKFFQEHIKKIEEIEKIMTKDITEDELEYFLNIIKKMRENLKGGNKNA